MHLIFELFDFCAPNKLHYYYYDTSACSYSFVGCGPARKGTVPVLGPVNTTLQIPTLLTTGWLKFEWGGGGGDLGATLSQFGLL